MKFLLILLTFLLIGCVGGEDDTTKEVKFYNYTKVIGANCSEIKYIHYLTQEEATLNYFNDLKDTITTKTLTKPFIDSRYMDIPQVISICEDNILSFVATIDLSKPHRDYLEYAGVQHSFGYLLDKSFYMWKDYSGLMLQANFNEPIYINKGGNSGGGVNFVLYLYNDKLNLNINYVIGVYAFNEGWAEEQQELHYDPTTKIVHIATVLGYNTLYSTLSPYSITTKKVSSTKEYSEYKDFARVLITYDDLMYALTRLKCNPPPELKGVDFGLSPEDWRLSLVLVQFELEENGDAYSNLSFKNFEIYSAKEQ